jgi:GntR family transcriptional regulator, transcriptional repressor for pyruvate dehydrogenase complex
MTVAEGVPGLSTVTGSRSQSEVVIDGIKNMITSGRLSAGSRLPVEKDLAEDLGVSRGSLREGVRALALMGVLESRQGDGTYVTALDPATLLGPLAVLVDLQRPGNMVDLMTVRRVLEVEAAGRAALRITDAELTQAGDVLAHMEVLIARDVVDHQAVMEADVALHRVIADASGNPTLSALIQGLASRTVRARTWRALHEEGAESRTQAEHQDILAALKARDPDAARLRMGVHLLGVEEYLSTQLDADTAVATG